MFTHPVHISHHMRDHPTSTPYYPIGPTLSSALFIHSTTLLGFKRTVMVLAPFHDPVPLTRAWCLWELFCTIKTNSVFEVAMSSEERTRFLEAISCNIRVVLDIMGVINLERSDAFKPTDKVNTHQTNPIAHSTNTISTHPVKAPYRYTLSIQRISTSSHLIL